MTTAITLLPVPKSPFVDLKTGLVNREWYLFLNNLLILVGGGQGGSATQVLHGANAGFSTVMPADMNRATLAQIIIGQGATADVAYKAISGDGTLVSSGAITINGTNGALFTSYATAVTGQLLGTATNDSANPGSIGELLSSTVASGSAVTINTGVAKNITSVSITAGDWDVTGQVDYVLNAATTTDFQSGSSTTSATFGAQDSSSIIPLITTLVSDTFGQTLPVFRYSFATATTVFLVGAANFSAGGVTGYGTIRARRVR